MKAFIDYAEARWRTMTDQPASIEKTLSLLTAARQAAGDTVYGKRIDLLVEYCKPLAQLSAGAGRTQASP